MICMDIKTFKDKNVTEKIKQLILTLEENGFYMECNLHKTDIQNNICFIKGNFLKRLHIHISDMSVYYCNLRFVFLLIVLVFRDFQQNFLICQQCLILFIHSMKYFSHSLKKNRVFFLTLNGRLVLMMKTTFI